MNKKTAEGFTIIELLIGMVGLAIIAVAVGSMLVYGWMGWRKNAESVAMQQNAKVAMRLIEQGIRNANTNVNVNAITWDSDGIYFSDPDDLNFSALEFTAGSMVQVDAFNVAVNPSGGIDVSFTLSTASGSDENTYQMTIYPRN